MNHYRNVYTPKLGRHIYSVSINGFYARELDADDVAFLEHVRECGTANCGSLADPIPTTWYDRETHLPLAEDLQYWETPWEREEGVARRLGSKPAEQFQNRFAREEADRLRRERYAAKVLQREADKAAMATELAREEEEWTKSKAQIARESEARRLQTLRADIEWETANPNRVRARRRNSRQQYTGPRFYEPVWRTEERLEPTLRMIRKYARHRKREEYAKLYAKLIAEQTAEAERAAAAEAVAASDLAARAAEEAKAAARTAAAEHLKIRAELEAPPSKSVVVPLPDAMTEDDITRQTLNVFWSLPHKTWEPLVRAAMAGSYNYKRVVDYFRIRQILPPEQQKLLELMVAPRVLVRCAPGLISAAQRWNHNEALVCP